jgi:hypothetical protein
MYTNKLNNKKYVGQSIHCGKRFDQHFKGNQLIDDIIQLEGIENFNFEILKQVDKSELSYWEDYYILKHNTMFPNGYNRKWNCPAAIREQIGEILEEEEFAAETTPENSENLKRAPAVMKGDEGFLKYPSDKNLLISMNYEDNLYAWLLLQAHYNQNEDYYYLYKNSFTFIRLSESLKKSRQTISKEFKHLQDLGLITEGSNFGEKIYILPCRRTSQLLCRNTLSTLLEISCERKLNELIKTFIYTLNIKKENRLSQPIAAGEVLNYFNHSIGHKTSYERVRNNLKVLQEMPKIRAAIDESCY